MSKIVVVMSVEARSFKKRESEIYLERVSGSCVVRVKGNNGEWGPPPGVVSCLESLPPAQFP